MRTTIHEQPPLMPGYIDHLHAKELAVIDELLVARPAILLLVLDDLLPARKNSSNGRPGMTAEQVLRAVIIKQMTGFSYAALAFHLADSQCYRTFCRIGHFSQALTKARLQRNIKRLKAKTLESINREFLQQAKELGVEAGRKVRIDATVVDTNIHRPTDSSMLFDSVRVLSRLMKRGQKQFGVPGEWHTRRAKRRALEILNTKHADVRVAAYRDLLNTTRRSMRAAQVTVTALRLYRSLELLGEVAARGLADELERHAELADHLVYQTEERVLKGNSLPQDEKLFSIFETHTDIIIKDRREVQYGHKVTLTTGKSGLVLDCVIEDGNPADSTLAKRMIERQQTVYGRVPRQASFDGGYTSKLNVQEIKGMGVLDVVMHKRRGIDISEMARSSNIFKSLCRFRAGIEGGISYLKRSFGLDRCTWRGLSSFGSYVWSSILSANLLMLARHQLSVDSST